MARASTTDFLHNMRFHVVEQGNFLDPAAGFNSVSIPEMTVEAVDYKEGIDTFTRKYPGNPTMNELTLSKGVARTGTDFFNWVLAAIQGGGYRTDLAIWQFHRDDPKGITDGAPSKVYHVFEAFASRSKPATDLDATSSDVALEEIDIVFESFDIEIANRNA